METLVIIIQVWCPSRNMYLVIIMLHSKLGDKLFRLSYMPYLPIIRVIVCVDGRYMEGHGGGMILRRLRQIYCRDILNMRVTRVLRGRCVFFMYFSRELVFVFYGAHVVCYVEFR